jgi:hypothetical protein
MGMELGSDPIQTEGGGNEVMRSKWIRFGKIQEEVWYVCNYTRDCGQLDRKKTREMDDEWMNESNKV